MRSRKRLVQPAGKRGIVWVAMDDTAPQSYLVERCRRPGSWSASCAGTSPRMAGSRSVGSSHWGIRDEREYGMTVKVISPRLLVVE